MSWWKFWEREPPSREVSERFVAAEAMSLPRSAGRDATSTSPMPGSVTSERRGIALEPGRATMFDPALRHLPRGLIGADPVFATADERIRWQLLQRRVMSHVLRTIGASPWSERLVLRGSALMCVWFGDAARQPKDLDFVVVPESTGKNAAIVEEMLSEIAAAVTGQPCPGVELSSEAVEREDIWAYERVPGTRLQFRWTAPGMPSGNTQLDFVFGESLPVEPAWQDVALDGGAMARLQVAARDLSLAWKLRWLHTDGSIRAKDLYDAMLLAEETPISAELLATVFVGAEQDLPPVGQLADVLSDVRDVEWVDFEVRDAVTLAEWQRRLRTALRIV